MRRMWIFWVLICALGLGAGCSPQAEDEAGGPHELGEADAGTTVDLAMGEQVLVRLPGNITTGYAWEIAQINAEVLAQVGETVYERDSELIGAGEMSTFTFEAVGAGQSDLKLIYHRSFEADVPPLKAFDLIVVVK